MSNLQEPRPELFDEARFKELGDLIHGKSFHHMIPDEELLRDEWRQQYAHQEAKHIVDTLEKYPDPTKRLTLLFHQDGTDESLNQDYIQTDDPDTPAVRMRMLFEAMHRIAFEYTDFSDPKVFEKEAEDLEYALMLLTDWDSYAYAFAHLTKAEAELQADNESHLSVYERCQAGHRKEAPEPKPDYITCDYPPIFDERKYVGWGYYEQLISGADILECLRNDYPDSEWYQAEYTQPE